jgi:hypothetical protein
MSALYQPRAKIPRAFGRHITINRRDCDAQLQKLLPPLVAAAMDNRIFHLKGLARGVNSVSEGRNGCRLQQAALTVNTALSAEQKTP